jgi:fluoride ion exporter CrcB/FEX
VWIAYLWVILGSAIGGAARYALSGVVANWIGANFPWGTLIVNVTGCFVIGIFNTVTGPDGGGSSGGEYNGAEAIRETARKLALTAIDLPL